MDILLHLDSILGPTSWSIRGGRLLLLLAGFSSPHGGRCSGTRRRLPGKARQEGVSPYAAQGRCLWISRLGEQIGQTPPN